MSRGRWGEFSARHLVAQTEVRVRFQEVDALGIVWHGHFLSFLEDGRHAFGRRYEFTYDDILNEGFIVPIVRVELDFLAPVRFGQTLNVVTRLHCDAGARISFSYEVQGPEGKVVATGRSVQVFTRPDGSLVLVRPRFFEAFFERWAAEVRE